MMINSLLHVLVDFEFAFTSDAGLTSIVHQGSTDAFEATVCKSFKSIEVFAVYG
jgi:hypothetical protein